MENMHLGRVEKDAHTRVIITKCKLRRRGAVTVQYIEAHRRSRAQTHARTHARRHARTHTSSVLKTKGKRDEAYNLRLVKPTAASV